MAVSFQFSDCKPYFFGGLDSTVIHAAEACACGAAAARMDVMFLQFRSGGEGGAPRNLLVKVKVVATSRQATARQHITAMEEVSKKQDFYLYK